MKTQHAKTYGRQKISIQKEMYSCKHLYLRKGRSHISNLTFYLKEKKGENWKKGGKTKPQPTKGRNNKDWSREN